MGVDKGIHTETGVHMVGIRHIHSIGVGVNLLAAGIAVVGLEAIVNEAEAGRVGMHVVLDGMGTPAGVEEMEGKE